MVPSVSVITPAFNASRFIADAVRSVLAQTFGDLEMLVVDDRSKDDTVDVVRALAQADARVRLILREENGGPAAARNTALEQAAGRFVAFLDSDDVWLPGKLEAQLRFMQDRGAPLSYTQYRRISESGELISPAIPIPSELDYRRLLKHNALATSTVIVDRQRTGDVRMTRTYYDDFALWLKILKKGFIAHGLRKDLVRYRVVAGSWSRNKLRSAYYTWKTYREVERLSLLPATWYLVHYAWNGYKKYTYGGTGRPVSDLGEGKEVVG